MDRRHLRPVLAAVTVPALVLGLGACSSDNDVDSFSGGFDLEHDDPMGFVACRDVIRLEDVDDEDERDRLLDAIAANAATSETRSIRGTVDPPVDPTASERVGPDQRGRYTVDVDALRSGCEDAGFAYEDVADNPEG